MDLEEQLDLNGIGYNTTIRRLGFRLISLGASLAAKTQRDTRDVESNRLTANRRLVFLGTAL